MHTCRIAAAPQKEARKWMEKGTITTTTITTLLPLNHNSVLHAHIFQGEIEPQKYIWAEEKKIEEASKKKGDGCRNKREPTAICM